MDEDGWVVSAATATREPAADVSVPLPEALTWIAFGDAMPVGELREAIESQLSWFKGFQKDKQRLEDALMKLMSAADEGKVSVEGTYCRDFRSAKGRTVPISNRRLRDFNQFDPTTGALQRGPIGSPGILWGEAEAANRALDGWLEEGHKRQLETQSDPKFAYHRDPDVEHRLSAVEGVAEHYLNVRVKCADWRKTFPLGMARRAKKPPLPIGTLNAWWDKRSETDRRLPQDDLLQMCKQEFPTHSISRQRVRDLDPDRKRGPKPFRGKMSAK
jgi:hypothetical protein